MMTNNHDSCECKAHGRTLTFLLSNDAYQYIVLSKYDPELYSDRKFLFLSVCAKMLSQISFGSLMFILHILRSLCKFVKCCHLLAHMSHCSLTTSVAFCNCW